MWPRCERENVRRLHAARRSGNGYFSRTAIDWPRQPKSRITVRDLKASFDSLVNEQRALGFTESDGTTADLIWASNEVEKTIFIKSPKSVHYGDVVKVIDAAKLAGAQPIGLQIDDLSE